MNLHVTVYKPTGKFYADHSVTLPDTELFTDEFKKLVRENLPGRYKGGFVVVQDDEGNSSFHNALYTWRDLFPEDYCDQAYFEMCSRRERGDISPEQFDEWYNLNCAHCHYMNEVCMFGEDGGDK